MPLDLSDDKSTLVQVMAWCRQATSHYLSQCWPSSLSPYGVTRPQWVNVIELGHTESSNGLVPSVHYFSKFSLGRLPKFAFVNTRLYMIKKKKLSKSTCPTASFTCPGPSDSGYVEPWFNDDPNSGHHMASLGHNNLITNYEYYVTGSYLCLVWSTTIPWNLIEIHEWIIKKSNDER